MLDYISPVTPGLHTVISPDSGLCKAVTILRLNLLAGERFTLETGTLEMNPLLIEGEAEVPMFDAKMVKNDSFYLPGKMSCEIIAGDNGASFYIGAAPCDGIGKPFFRVYDPTLPIGEIHQIHGEGSGQREVFFTLNEEVPASRLICGFTKGGDGTWTSWPPHQHEEYLEEAYCYYDMPEPMLGYQLYYKTGQKLKDAVITPVRSGSVELIPDGYHPTSAAPGTRNTYFWVMAAFEPAKRSYNKQVKDPDYAG